MHSKLRLPLWKQCDDSVLQLLKNSILTVSVIWIKVIPINMLNFKVPWADVPIWNLKCLIKTIWTSIMINLSTALPFYAILCLEKNGILKCKRQWTSVKIGRNKNYPINKFLKHPPGKVAHYFPNFAKIIHLRSYFSIERTWRDQKPPKVTWKSISRNVHPQMCYMN